VFFDDSLNRRHNYCSRPGPGLFLPGSTLLWPSTMVLSPLFLSMILFMLFVFGGGKVLRLSNFFFPWFGPRFFPPVRLESAPENAPQVGCGISGSISTRIFPFFRFPPSLSGSWFIQLMKSFLPLSEQVRSLLVFSNFFWTSCPLYLFPRILGAFLLGFFSLFSHRADPRFQYP